MNSVKVPTISQEILRGLSVESKAPIERLADFLANTHLPDLSVSCLTTHLFHSHDVIYS